jgi:non-canonical purine NTP pyrophosphatase (RdgB/HAM1 family)
MNIAIASTNKHKIEEIRHKLSDLKSIEFMPADSIAEIGPIDETGSTFEENALIKAREVSRITKIPSLADDSGLAVDALGGEPGIYSARYGNLSSDSQRNELLLSKLENIPDGKRTARFICSIALVFPDGKEFTVRGECEGIIAHSPSGSLGFGYDPVFYIPDRGKTFAELSLDEKNKISHRARALDRFHELLDSLMVK